MMQAPRHRGWERRSPAAKNLEGLTLDMVCRIERRARTRATHPESGATAQLRWRQWYSVRLQMLLDGIDTCPANFRWEPLSLTC